MRPFAALLLGGLCCCGGSLQAETRNESPDASADVASEAVLSRTADSASLVLSAGTFALVEAYGYPYYLGAAYVARPQTSWRLAPGAGFALGPDGIGFMYVDVRRDFRLSAHWYFTPSLATGWFLNGDVIGPRDHLEFQSGIQFAREFANGLRLGLAGQHVSNAGLEPKNNGTEILLLTLQLPLKK